ncbi:MAG: alpha-L-fucosidase [Bacteroidales bacterium]|nr:alpha-L-fucosidase [Bacteroidales bacterium]
MKKFMFALLTTAFLLTPACKNAGKKEMTTQNISQPTDKMQWWRDAKFGMFIHWGVYSVPAGVYKGHKINGIGEWIMNYAKIPVAEYKAYAKSFNPVKYDPDAWVSLAKEAGMKYMVITSKHHDGFGMFDSEVTDWDIVDATPYKKDVIGALVKAARKQDMHIGLYYSQAQDWSHPGGAAYRKLARAGWDNPDSAHIDKFTAEHDGHWDPAQLGSFDEYLDKIAVPQTREILAKYHPDILWWDTPKNMTKERAEKFLPVIAPYPDLITNNRLGGGISGDLETPEQYIPATGYPGRNWEVCMTMNDTWGYKSWDHNWKSGKDLLLKLSEIVSKGGNFLLNVGPTSEGLIPQASIDRLKYIGTWMKKNGEAVYGTTASPFPWLPWGRATLKGDKLYLHVYDWPRDGSLKVPLLNTVTKGYLLADPGHELKVKKHEGSVEVTLPAQAPDPVISIVVLEYEGAAPDVLPVPTDGKSGQASSSDPDAPVSALFDGDPKDKWMPAEGETTASVEVDLGEPVTVGHIALVEPWHPWSHKSQHFKLQVKEGEQWKTVLEEDTGGTGHQQEFGPVKGQYFRLVITGPDGDRPVLNEWVLNRALLSLKKLS